MNRLIFWLGVLGVSLLANSVVKGWNLTGMPGDTKKVVTCNRISESEMGSRNMIGESYMIIKKLFN